MKSLNTEFNAPNAIDVEKILIGALILESHQYPKICSILTPEDFYYRSYGILYACIGMMCDSGKKVDLFTIAQDPKFHECGLSLLDLANLTENIGSASHTEYHAQIIKQKAIARELILAGLTISKQAQDSSMDVQDVLDFASDSIMKIAERAISSQHSSSHIKDVTLRALVECENRVINQRKGTPIGISTGIGDLDKMLGGGFRLQDLIVLAGRPSMGKTAFVLNCAKIAAMQGVHVSIYSLEMSDISLANRLILSECDIPGERFRGGCLSNEELKTLDCAGSKLSKLPIYVCDKPSISMRYIESHAMIMKRKGRCGLIVIDYLQLTDVSTKDRGRSREQEITQATAKAKAMAKNLNVPVILLSQLSRKVEDRTDKRPVLSDLRESGSIEQDADIVLFIQRPAYYKIPQIEISGKGIISTQGVGIISIAKQRDGATGDAFFSHNAQMNKFYPLNNQLEENE